MCDCVQTPTQTVLKAQEQKLTFYVVFFLAFLGKQVEYGFHLCFLTTFGMASMLVLSWLPMLAPGKCVSVDVCPHIWFCEHTWNADLFQCPRT